MKVYKAQISIKAPSKEEAERELVKIVNQQVKIDKREKADKKILQKAGITKEYIYKKLKTKIDKSKSQYIQLSCFFLISELIGTDTLCHEDKELFKRVKIYLNNQIYEMEKQRNELTKSLRMQVLERDNFTCKKCGRTREDKVKFHVDHIIPVSKGGKTILSNLETLCADCNIGKRNKIIH